jgi:PAS domain S-box-containing protein
MCAARRGSRWPLQCTHDTHAKHGTAANGRHVPGSSWGVESLMTDQSLRVLLVEQNADEAASAAESATRYRTLVDSMEEAVLSKTPEGVITSWNPAAAHQYGYSAAEAIGQPVTMLAPPGHEEEMASILARIRDGQRVPSYETVRRRKDGSLVDIALTVSPIVDSNGRIVGASSIGRDISERKLAEAQLRASEERFRESFYQASMSIRLSAR